MKSLKVFKNIMYKMASNLQLIKVINLDKRPQRFKTFMSGLKNTALNNIKVERFSAIDGSNLVDDLKSKGLKGDPIFKTLIDLNMSIPRGELGCLLSHYFVLREIEQNEYMQDNDYVLIYEDDVFFTDYDVTKYFEHIDEFVKETEVDLIYVSGRWRQHFLPSSNGMSFFERKSKHFFLRKNGNGHDWDRCTPAFIYTKVGAKKIINRILNYFIVTKRWNAIDNILSLTNDNVVCYDFFPHIFYAKPDFETDVQGQNLANKINTNELNELI
jgi:GR25 family glycosyltransferase involved in LPS biosynthesis